MHWEVQLIGDSGELAMLADAFTGSELNVERRAQGYVIVSTLFESLASADDVRERAKETVTAMSGAVRLELGSQVGLAVGAVYRIHDDGKSDITIFAEPMVVHVRALLSATFTVTTADGVSKVHRPADPISMWLPLAQEESLVAKALRLRDHHPLNWSDLFRIYEVVQSDEGSDQMIARGWVTKCALNRFTHTANSVTAAGDDARHGFERTEPPRNPMSLSEARQLVDTLLRAWLGWKSSQNPRRM